MRKSREENKVVRVIGVVLFIDWYRYTYSFDFCYEAD